MALRYLDSMGDHYTAAQATTKWSAVSGVIRVAGLHGYGLTGLLRKGMLFPSFTVIMEAQVQLSAGQLSLFVINDTDPALHPQVSLHVGNDGAILVQRHATTEPAKFLAQTAPDVIRTGLWYHLAWRVYVHASAGTVEVRVNGGTVISVSGVQTTAVFPMPWSGAIGSFQVGGGASVVDDLVVMDDVDDGLTDPRLSGGGGFDQFLGPMEVKVKRPNGAGLLAEWTPSAGANWETVDDTDSDGDTTYNGALAAAVGASDLFAMEDVLPTEDVVAVQSCVLARKTEEGVAAVAVLVRDGGATTVGPDVYQPSTYAYLLRPEPTRPDGSLWSAAAWDAVQYGYRRTV